MFRGISATTIDAKGRITVPTKHREEIDTACGGRIALTVDIDRCVLIYPLPEWERVEASLLALPNLEQKVKQLQQFTVGYAKTCEIDGNYRINIPQELRDFASINKNVFLVGQGIKFALWDQERWNKKCEDWTDNANQVNAESALNQIRM